MPPVLKVGEMLLGPYLQMTSLFSDLSMLSCVLMSGSLVFIVAYQLRILHHILPIRVLEMCKAVPVVGIFSQK